MLLLEKAPAGAVARRRRIPERPQIKSPIFFRFRRIAAFEPRLPKSADCQAITVGNMKETLSGPLDVLDGVRFGIAARSSQAGQSV
jgi:hypothetical protein